MTKNRATTNKAYDMNGTDLWQWASVEHLPYFFYFIFDV